MPGTPESPHPSGEVPKSSEIMEAEARSKLLETPETKFMKEALHRNESKLRIPAVPELVRFLESDKYPNLSDVHIGDVSRHLPIEIEGELFFNENLTGGGASSRILTLSKEGNLGREFVLEELRDLQRLLEERGKLRATK